MSNDTDPIVVEQIYPTSIAAVWKAITDKDQMRQWFFEPMTEFQPEPGFETEFNVHHEGRDYLHQWRITDVVPEEKIVYNWKYGGYPGDSTVVWELSETPDGTKLVLTHQTHEPFSQDDPVFSRESGVAGWNYFIRESLKAFLERQSND
jgi:uncharacterized protein YndB with AHSA1/START domain